MCLTSQSIISLRSIRISGACHSYCFKCASVFDPGSTGEVRLVTGLRSLNILHGTRFGASAQVSWIEEVQVARCPSTSDMEQSCVYQLPWLASVRYVGMCSMPRRTVLPADGDPPERLGPIYPIGYPTRPSL